MKKKIAINGMGRIGRTAFKILLERDDFELTAVNDLVPADNLVSRLTYGCVNGWFAKKVRAGEDFIEVDDRIIRKYSEKDPENLPWRKNEIDVVLECTGMFTNRQNLEKHIHAGAKHVILSAPSREDDIQTVVYGANTMESSEQVLSCGNGSANCIGPVMEIIDRRLGIQKAVITTHPYNAAQTPVDASSENRTQGQSAADNFGPASIDGDLAISRILPELNGLYDCVSFRGPAPKGYIADIVICTVKATSVDEVNSVLAEEADSERYGGVLGVSRTPVGSSNIIMDPRASIVDLSMTRVVGGDLVKIMSWYDNEWGYGNQIVRTAQQLLKTYQ